MQQRDPCLAPSFYGISHQNLHKTQSDINKFQYHHTKLFCWHVMKIYYITNDKDKHANEQSVNHEYI